MKHEFQIGCAVCKALGDIPEVQTVIALLDPLIRDEFARRADRVLAEVMRRLGEFRTTAGLPDVDVLRRGVTEVERERREDLLVAILGSLMLYIERAYSAPLSPDVEGAIEGAVDELLRAGAAGEGLVLDLSSEEVARQAARSELPAILAGSILLRRNEIEEALRSFLTSGGPRAAVSVLEAPGSSAQGRGAFVSRLGQILAPVAALAASVDAWAYRWFGIGAIKAGVAAAAADAFGLPAGVAGFRLDATVDAKTTRFCRWVNGRIVPLAQVERQVQEHVQNALRGDVVGMASNWPFLSPEVARGGSPLQFERFFRRAGLPPYHFGCRTRPRRVTL